MAAATTVGIVMVGTSAAGAAVALPEADCESYEDHVLTTGELDADWYMDCVPLYGAGKTTVVFESDEPLPEGLDLFAPENAASTPGLDPASAGDYLLTPVDGAGLTTRPVLEDAEPAAGDPYRYVAQESSVVVPIAGVSSVAVPADCAAVAPTTTFSNAYSIAYAPTTRSYRAVVDGIVYSAEFTVAPQPLVFAFSPDTQAGTTGDICVVGRGAPFVTESRSTVEFASFFGVDTLRPEGLGGTFPITTAAVVAEPDPVVPPATPTAPAAAPVAAVPAAPELAATGVDGTPLVVGITALLAGLALAVGARFRRRGAAEQA